MNYQHIEREAGAAAARIIEAGEPLDYDQIDPEEVDELTRGALVLGAETIDAPDPDGIIIYMRLPSGKALALVVETTADESGLYELIETRAATIEGA